MFWFQATPEIARRPGTMQIATKTDFQADFETTKEARNHVNNEKISLTSALRTSKEARNHVYSDKNLL